MKNKSTHLLGGVLMAMILVLGVVIFLWQKPDRYALRTPLSFSQGFDASTKKAGDSRAADSNSVPGKVLNRPSVIENLPTGSTIVDDGSNSGKWVGLLPDGTRIEASAATPTSQGVEFKPPIRATSGNPQSVMELNAPDSRLWVDKTGGKLTTSGEVSLSSP